MMIPTITPNRPRRFEDLDGEDLHEQRGFRVDNAHEDPAAATRFRRLSLFTVNPAANMAYPDACADCGYWPFGDGATYSILVCRMMAMMTP